MDYAVPNAPRLKRLRTHWIGVTIILTTAVVNLAVTKMAGGVRDPWLVEMLFSYETLKPQATIGLVLLGLALIAREVVPQLLDRRVMSAQFDLTVPDRPVPSAP